LNPSDPTKPGLSAATAGQTGVAVGGLPGRLSRVRAYRLLWSIAVAVFVADQATKLWIVARVPFDPMHSHSPGTDIEVINGFFYIIHVGNTGAAWSMFTGRSITLALLAAGTLIAIFLWRHTLGLKHRLTQVCFGLLCGGIVGNLLDRLVHHHVIDFIDLHFGTYWYPTFNVADSAICVGVILYLWQSLKAPRTGQEQVDPPNSESRSDNRS
jgi:signal peptidase II